MTRRFFLFLLASLLLTACTHRAKWLHGSWIFDGERTAQVLEQQSGRVGEDRGIIESLKDLATGLMAPPLIAKYQGTRIEFTDKEMIVTDSSGNGHAQTYEVLESPDANTLRLKHADGEIVTYHREGEHMWRVVTGTSGVRVYFRRLK